jgi:hypothetical protein
MSTTSVNNLSSSYLQALLGSQVQNVGSAGTANSTGPGIATDRAQISPLASVLSTLQQLQQSDPGKYQQVTQQIATNLQTAAQTAQSAGNTATANQLSQFATDFSTASANDQLPSVPDLAEAAGAGQHHHHHFNQDSGGGSNPIAIIANTLASAGVTEAG